MRWKPDGKTMTGVKFLVRVTLRRLDLAAEIYHLREPQKIPQVMSPDETRRLLAVASSLKVRVLLSLGYGRGLRAGEVVRLKVKHIDRAQNIIRVEQSKGKDRNVMLSPEMLTLLRQWWKVRPTRWDASVPPQERWLFPGRKPGRPMTTRYFRSPAAPCRVAMPIAGAISWGSRARRTTALSQETRLYPASSPCCIARRHQGDNPIFVERLERLPIHPGRARIGFDRFVGVVH